MSTPTQPMPGTEVRAEITRFVAAVEHALDDLPRDDAAELTDGLEADLIEAWAVEGVRPGERFGSPASYAAELRTAAGLPSRGRRGINGPAAIRLQWQQDRERLLGRLRGQPWWPQAVEYGHELRPAWWALRGATLVLLAVFVVGSALGMLPGVIVLALPLVVWGAVVSMRAGAADRAPSGRSQGVLVIVNLVTAGCLAVAGIAALGSLGGGGGDYYQGASDYPPTSLTANGESVSNVFAYDAQGRPVTRFRLYDQSGRPLVVGAGVREGWDDTTGNHWFSKPDVGDGPQEWNLFPLLRVTERPTGGTDASGNGEVDQVQEPAVPPYAQLPALPETSAEPTAAPSASTSAEPTAAPSASTSATPSATPSARASGGAGS